MSKNLNIIMDTVISYKETAQHYFAILQWLNAFLRKSKQFFQTESTSFKILVLPFHGFKSHSS